MNTRRAVTVWVWAAALLALPLTLVALPAHAGIRTIVLVRHGQYDDDDRQDPEVGNALTELGRRQARITGERLAATTPKVDLVYASPMTRARETAAIIGEVLGKKPEILRDLRECTPPTSRQDIMAKERPGALDSCTAQLDRVYARFFRGTTGADSTIALVCHGNVTRYLISKALGMDLKQWLTFSVSHASLSKVRIRGDGAIQVVSVGDSGHLPPEIVTFTNPPVRKDSTATPR